MCINHMVYHGCKHAVKHIVLCPKAVQPLIHHAAAGHAEPKEPDLLRRAHEPIVNSTVAVDEPCHNCDRQTSAAFTRVAMPSEGDVVVHFQYGPHGWIEPPLEGLGQRIGSSSRFGDAEHLSRYWLGQTGPVEGWAKQETAAVQQRDRYMNLFLATHGLSRRESGKGMAGEAGRHKCKL